MTNLLLWLRARRLLLCCRVPAADLLMFTSQTGEEAGLLIWMSW